jgi:hypothetical protein
VNHRAACYEGARTSHVASRTDATCRCLREVNAPLACRSGLAARGGEVVHSLTVAACQKYLSQQTENLSWLGWLKTTTMFKTLGLSSDKRPSVEGIGLWQRKLPPSPARQIAIMLLSGTERTSHQRTTIRIGPNPSVISDCVHRRSRSVKRQRGPDRHPLMVAGRAPCNSALGLAPLRWARHCRSQLPRVTPRSRHANWKHRSQALGQGSAVAAHVFPRWPRR